MKKVICSGIASKEWHKCEERKCPHRIIHDPDNCTSRRFNSENRWCIAPGTTSFQDGYEDGGLVTCMSQKELKKETEKSLSLYLSKALEKKDECQRMLDDAKEKYDEACSLVKDIQRQIKELK